MDGWTHDVMNNSEENRNFAHALGYAILNCGVIELFTYSYTARLRGCHIFDTGIAAKTFAERATLVISLLHKAQIPEELRNRAITAWDEASSVMKRRNIIAHNPISMLRIQRESGQEEEASVVINMRSSTRAKIDCLEVSRLANLVNDAQSAVDALSKSLTDVEKALT